MFKKLSAAIAVAGLGFAGLTACSGDGSTTVVLQFSTHIGPTTPDGQALEEAFAQVEERSDGSIIVEPFWSGSLVAGDDALSALREGRADMAHISPFYFPSDLPLSELLSVPFAGTDPRASSTALDTLFDENEAFAEEYQAQKARPLAFVVPRAAALITTAGPVENLEALRGRSIRAASYTGTAFDEAGVNVAPLALPEVYESIDRGLIEGATSLTFDNIPSFSLHEVAPYVADTGVGPYIAQSVSINEDVWDDLSDSQRDVLDEVFGELSDLTWEAVQPIEDETCDAILDAGGSVNVWGEAEQEAFRTVIGDTLIEQWKSTAGPEADAFYTAFVELSEAEQDSSPSGMQRCADRSS